MIHTKMKVLRLRKCKRHCLQNVNDRLNAIFFIKQQAKRIGYFRVVMDDSGTTAKIGPIGVDPLVEGQGIGTQAMQLVEQTFPEVKEWRLSAILQETK